MGSLPEKFEVNFYINEIFSLLYLFMISWIYVYVYAYVRVRVYVRPNNSSCEQSLSLRMKISLLEKDWLKLLKKQVLPSLFVCIFVSFY